MSLEVIPVLIRRNVDSEDSITGLLRESKTRLQNGDVLIISQKIVSKIEGRVVELDTIIPSILSQGIASEYGKDSRIVEAILLESNRIVRMSDGIIITEARNGMICANAGVDESNVKKGSITLLPKDADASAERIRLEIKSKAKMNVAVIISDTFGRPFRMGQTDVAIGISGIESVRNYAGTKDRYGRPLRVTAIAISDELCSAAELAHGKLSGAPMTIIRNYAFAQGGTALSLVRPREQDLFG